MPLKNDNLGIWERVERTDPAATKSFKRGGGFNGTATNPTYLAHKATDLFGPYGIGWGMDLLSSQFVKGHVFDELGNTEVIHIELWCLWYMRGDNRGEVTHYGQTTFVGKNKYGAFTDEEAPKKTKTDAMTKCLALLGFSADIHTGKFDDVKYVNDLKRDFASDEDKDAERQAAEKAVNYQAIAISRLSQAPSLSALQAVWLSLPADQKKNPAISKAKDEFKAALSAPNPYADIDYQKEESTQ